MSFSSDTKQELCRLEPERDCCRRAECYGAFLLAQQFLAFFCLSAHGKRYRGASRRAGGGGNSRRDGGGFLRGCAGKAAEPPLLFLSPGRISASAFFIIFPIVPGK